MDKENQIRKGLFTLRKGLETLHEMAVAVREGKPHPLLDAEPEPDRYDNPKNLEKALSLVGKTVQSATITDDGHSAATLELIFTDGTVVEAGAIGSLRDEAYLVFEVSHKEKA